MSDTSQETDKRQRILDAALRAFAEQGFYNTKISDVANYANVADGTIYLYFKNKDDLLISLFEDRMDWIIDRVTSAIEKSDGSVIDQIRNLIRMHFQMAIDRPKLAEFITVELRQSTKFVKEYKNERFYDYLGVMEGLLEKGINEGIFREDLDKQLVARSIFGALDEGLLALTLADSDQSDVEERTEQTSNMFIHGLLKQD
jgi:TetR/AcrR family fatty acid metabolism transcriptional regulator